MRDKLMQCLTLCINMCKQTLWEDSCILQERPEIFSLSQATHLKNQQALWTWQALKLHTLNGIDIQSVSRTTHCSKFQNCHYPLGNFSHNNLLREQGLLRIFVGTVRGGCQHVAYCFTSCAILIILANPKKYIPQHSPPKRKK